MLTGLDRLSVKRLCPMKGGGRWDFQNAAVKGYKRLAGA